MHFILCFFFSVTFNFTVGRELWQLKLIKHVLKGSLHPSFTEEIQKKKSSPLDRNDWTLFSVFLKFSITKHHQFLWSQHSCNALFLLHIEQCVLIRVDVQISAVALIESQNWSLIAFSPRGKKKKNKPKANQKKNNSDVFSLWKMSCVNRRSTSACHQLKETFPFK